MDGCHGDISMSAPSKAIEEGEVHKSGFRIEECRIQRQRQATQTAAKQRFLAFPFLVESTEYFVLNLHLLYFCIHSALLQFSFFIPRTRIERYRVECEYSEDSYSVERMIDLAARTADAGAGPFRGPVSNDKHDGTDDTP